MPDISMCKNWKCKKKKQCYRYTATPRGIAQSYFAGNPSENEDCEYFWPNEKEEE